MNDALYDGCDCCDEAKGALTSFSKDGVRDVWFVYLDAGVDRTARARYCPFCGRAFSAQHRTTSSHQVVLQVAIRSVVTLALMVLVIVGLRAAESQLGLKLIPVLIVASVVLTNVVLVLRAHERRNRETK